MKTFILALFSIVALLGLVAPSFASEVTNLERETNGERLARGLPPNPPSRRKTAKRHRPSQDHPPPHPPPVHPPPHHPVHPPPPQKQYIEVHDINGDDILGFITTGGSHGLTVGWGLNFPVTYGGNTLSNGGQFVGGLDPQVGSLGSGHPTSVFLQKVSGSNHNAQSHIWTLGSGGILTASWTNSGGSHTPASFVLQGGSIKLTGDPAATGGTPVNLLLVHF